jgi:hypothetical protein
MIPFDPRQILTRLCQIINYGLILNLPLIESEVTATVSQDHV